MNFTSLLITTIMLAAPFAAIFFTRLSYISALKAPNSLQKFLTSEILLWRASARHMSIILMCPYMINLMELLFIPKNKTAPLAPHLEIAFIYMFLVGIIAVTYYIYCYLSLEKKEIQSDPNHMPKSYLWKGFHFFGYHIAFFSIAIIIVILSVK